MKLICEGLELSDAVLKVIRATATRTTNPILEGIKLHASEDTLTLSATDLEISIEKTIPADVKIAGEVVVPGKFFADFVKKLSNEQIELSLTEENTIRIKYTDSEGYLQCMNADEFPIIKEIYSPEKITIKKVELKKLIDKTVFSVAVDDARPILKGCLFEVENNEITSVALDGYRLAMVKTSVTSTADKLSCIIPARSLNEISKLLNIDNNEETIDILVGQNHLLIVDGSIKILTRLLEGEFINYKQVIPATTSTTILVNKEQLEDGLDRASLLARMDKNNLVRFDIREKILTLTSASNIGNVTENITISLDGKDISIAFNARYLSDCMHTITDEFIKINFTSQIAPCTICPAEDENKYLYLILPVRIVD
ncbi:MAG: DNA polymerase III subunit beta [Clostridia bacterium]|nr:DNA polymerase III subunit beta [Clostridia bacterium]